MRLDLKLSSQRNTVRLSSNDHPKMGSLIPQVLDLKTLHFNIASKPLGIQGLNTALVDLIHDGIHDIVIPNKSMGQKSKFTRKSCLK